MPPRVKNGSRDQKYTRVGSGGERVRGIWVAEKRGRHWWLVLAQFKQSLCAMWSIRKHNVVSQFTNQALWKSGAGFGSYNFTWRSIMGPTGETTLSSKEWFSLRMYSIVCWSQTSPKLKPRRESNLCKYGHWGQRRAKFLHLARGIDPRFEHCSIKLVYARVQGVPIKDDTMANLFYSSVSTTPLTNFKQ